MESIDDSEVESEDGDEKVEQSQILYDIVTYKEWEQEPEVVKPSESTYRFPGGCSWYSPGVAGGGVLSQQVERLVGAQLPWSIAVADNASLIAVLQDSCIEIWSSKDNYGLIVGRRPLDRDPCPQWRQICWTEDSSMLALSYSSGQVDVMDTLGSHMFSVMSHVIPASQPGWSDSLHRTGPTHHSYCAMFLTDTRVKDKKWTSELVLVELSGRIISFLVSPSGYQELVTFSVGWNLTSAIWCPGPDILVTSSGDSSPLAGKRRLVGRASHEGIVALRLLNDTPHFVKLLDAEEVTEVSASSWNFFSSTPKTDYIIAMEVSNCGSRLAAVHQSGTISIWRLPSLTLESSTLLAEQPGYNEINPHLLQAPEKRKAKAEFLANPLRYHPVNVAWWNTEAVAVARMSGALSVIGTQDLSNLLGDSPEFLEGVPKISRCFEKGFFGLECESVLRGRRPSSFSDSAGEDPDVELEESENEDTDGLSGWLSLGKRSGTAVAYYITDSERFAPPKKKAKIMRKTYRLLALVSTTPQELFNRKIAAEEYGEAIMLAQHYGLDSDPVYERQWQTSNKSSAAIHDYLAKMKRRSTVFKECLETIPDDLDSARQLLLYGLRGTDLEALISLEKDGDTGEFVLCDQQRVLDDFDTMEEKEKAEKAAMNKLIVKVNWQHLNLVQKDLIRTRHTLLYYLDCLDTLEDILGGGQRAADKFTITAFSKLRSHSPMENCLMAARYGDHISLISLLSCAHSHVTLAHWLPLLSCFPETLQSDQYSDLLPVISLDGGVVPFFQHPVRELDWSEQSLALKWSGHKIEYDTDILYQGSMAIAKKFSSLPLTASLVGQWYEERAREISIISSLPDVALDLLQAGLERGVNIPWRLLHSLRTLDCLVYEVQSEDLSLDKLEDMDSPDQMVLLMSGPGGNSILAVRKFLVPFLQRLEDNIPGEMGRLLTQFCTKQAETDLTFPLVIVEYSGPDKTGPVLYGVTDTIRLALDCCYANTSGAQVDLMEKLFISVVGYLGNNPTTRQPRYNIPLHMRTEVEKLKIHLDIARTLTKNGVIRPLSLFRDHCQDESVIRKVFDSVMARAEGAKPSLDNEGWRMVFRDLQLLQSLLPIVQMEGIVYSYCESLLSSGSSSNISLAGSVIEGMMDRDDQIKLVITAWRHYYSISGDLNDPNLDLARQVLSLVRDTGPLDKDVAVCHDLIGVLQSMTDFGLGSVLPVTILECKDRLQFVKMAVNARPTAYKNSQRLMKLASLLKISPDKLEGEVWVVIARKALEVRDFLFSHTACNNFIKAGFTKGWDICYALAAQADFTDLEKCNELLSFAVTHCDDKHIEDIMQTMATMEQKNFTRNMSTKIEANSTHHDPLDDEDELFEDTVEDLDNRSSREPSPLSLEITAQLLNIPSLSKQYLLDNKVSVKVWQQTAGWLNQIGNASMSQSFHEDEVINKDFEAVGVPAFYLDLNNDKVQESKLDLAYNKFSKPPLSSNDISLASYQILRYVCLTNSLVALSSEEDDLQMSESVISGDLLQKLLPLVASQDIQLGLLLILTISDPLEAENILTSLPLSFPGLCFVITYFSILVMSDHLTKKDQDIGQIFSMSPLQIVQNTLHLNNGDKEGKSDDVKYYYTKIEEYLEMAIDYHQGNLLSGLSGDVDVNRFTSDSQYKEDTILGLALFPDQDKWDFTLSLARRYGIDMWVVAATHLETVFNEPSISSGQAKQLIDDRDLVDLLSSREPNELIDWMSTKVLPLLFGEDIERLLLFYSVLDKVTDGQFENNISALEKIKKSGIVIDFTLLSSGSKDLLDILDERNVYLIAEIVDLLKGDDKFVTSSSVFSSWAFSVFMKHGKSTENWIEAFSVCQKFMDKMSSTDFMTFAKKCILSEHSIKSVPRSARGRIFKKAVKYVEIKMAEKAIGNWKDVENWLDMVKIHSEKFKQKISIEIISNVEEKYSYCFDLFEMTGGDEMEILRMLSDLILSEVKISVVKDVIKIWRQDREGVEEGLVKIMTSCVGQILEDDPKITDNPYRLIQSMCNNYDLFSETVSNLLVPLATLDKVPVSHRLEIVNILKKFDSTAVTEEVEQDNARLAEMYNTQHKIEEVLGDHFKVEMTDLEDLDAKQSLYSRMLIHSYTSDQAIEMYRLTKEWNEFEEQKVDDLNDNIILQLGLRLLEIDGTGNSLLDSLDEVTDSLFPSHIKEEMVNKVENLEISDIFKTKLILKLELESKYVEVLEFLSRSDSCDPILASLVVTRRLASSLVITTFYPALVDQVVDLYSTSGDNMVQMLVEQLDEAGHQPQAASLQMMIDGMPSSLRTMTSLLQRFFNK